PVALANGSVFVAADGVLDALDGATLSTVGDLTATGVGRRAGVGYLCSRTKLFTLDGVGPGPLLFDLADIRPPDLALVRPELRSACGDQWSVFLTDLRVIGVVGADAGAPRTPDHAAGPLTGSSSCGIARRGRDSDAVAPRLAVFGAALAGFR